jgi:hypothetical protein
MSEYKNGLYTYLPSKDVEEQMSAISLPQVIEIIEGEVWLTGVSQSFDVDYVDALGAIGKMVMSQEGVIS